MIIDLKKDPGRYVRARYPKSGQKNTPSKWEKLKIIRLKNKYYRETQKPTLRRFITKYRNCRSGSKKWINKLKYRTWTEYHQEFKPGSKKYKLLKKFNKKYKNKRIKETKRFYRHPFKANYGVCPVFEEYLVHFREIVGREYEWRSVTWLISEAKRFIQNKRIIRLLSPFMTNQERKIIKLLKVTRRYIYLLMVW